MPRNPFWTSSNAALFRSLLSVEGTLQFNAAPTATSYDNIGSFGSQLSTQDFVRVDLKADATYTFLATGTYQVTLSIYDAEGYLLLFTDGSDAYPQDSILSFRPDYSGTFYLTVGWEYLGTASGVYGIGGTEDRFSDGRNSVVAPISAFSTAYGNIMRATPAALKDETWASDISGKLLAGTLTNASAIDLLIDHADGTTSVATLAYQFFTGAIPGGGGYDYLLSPTGPNPNNLNSAYYQTFTMENRYINFAVNLGRDGEGKAKFLADYGSLSLFDATKKAYGTIFGAAPTDAKVTALLSGGRDLYFEGYGKDGLNGQGTKAAMVGWLLAEAAKGDIGMYAKANEAFLTDLADGAAFGVTLVGVYGKPDFVYLGG